MRKNLFGMLLVLGVGLAPLQRAAAVDFIPQVEQPAAAATEASSGASEISTGTAVAVSTNATKMPAPSKALTATFLGSVAVIILIIAL